MLLTLLISPFPFLSLHYASVDQPPSSPIYLAVDYHRTNGLNRHRNSFCLAAVPHESAIKLGISSGSYAVLFTQLIFFHPNLLPLTKDHTAEKSLDFSTCLPFLFLLPRDPNTASR